MLRLMRTSFRVPHACHYKREEKWENEIEDIINREVEPSWVSR